MENKSREILLKIGVGVVVGLFLLDRMVLSPAIAGWKAQSERLDRAASKSAARPAAPRAREIASARGGTRCSAPI